MADEFLEIRVRLEAIAEELADLAILRLRESIDAGGTELSLDERRITRARRAVEQAAHLLAEPDAGGTEVPLDERRITRARRAVEKAAHLRDEPDDGGW